MTVVESRPSRDRGAIVVRNVGFNFLSQVWFSVLAIVVVPYMVHSLGADLFGVYVIVGSVLGYFAFLDLGLGSALTKYIAEYDAAGDMPRVARIMQTAVATYLALGVFGALVIAIATPWLIEHVFSVPPGDVDSAKLAFYIAALGFLVNLPGQTFGMVPAALQRFDVVFLRTVLFGTLSTVLTVAVLALGYGLPAIVLVNLFVTIATAFAFFLIAREMLPTIRLWPRVYRAEFRTLMSFGLLKASQRISGQLILQLDRVVVGIFLPIAAVAYYSVPLGLTQRVIRLVGNIAVAIFPAASALSGQKDERRITELYMRSMKLSALIALPLSAILFVYAHQIMRYWINPEFEAKSSSILMILALANLAYAFSAVPSNTLDATGSIGVSTAFSWFAAGTNIVLVFTLVPLMGVEGAAWAVFANALILIPFYLYYAHTRVFEISMRDLFSRALARPVLSLLPLLPLMVLARGYVSNVLELAILIALTVLAYVGISIAFGTYDARDRGLLRGFLRR